MKVTSRSPRDRNNMTTALIDGDVVAYRSAFIGMNEGWMEDEACDTAAWLTEQWAQDAACDDLIMCLSPSSTFRHDMATSYKAHRKKREKPLWLSEIRSFLAERFESVTHKNIEADDSMGILQTSMDDTVIVTVDKDLLQIKGRHWNPVKQEACEVDCGWELFLTQWLTGDATDGYPGLKGIGPKKAAAFIEEHVECEQAIVDWYIERGHDWAHCLVQARMAMILTADRWDNDREEPLLYVPPLPSQD